MRFYPTTPPPWRLEITGLTAPDTIKVWIMDVLDEKASPSTLRPIDDVLKG